MYEFGISFSLMNAQVFDNLAVIYSILRENIE